MTGSARRMRPGLSKGWKRLVGLIGGGRTTAGSPDLSGAKNAAWPVSVLVVRGDAHERGVQHGQTLRESIAEYLATKMGRKARALADAGRQYDRLLETVKSLARGDELLEEMRGIAEGSGQPFRTIAALNLGPTLDAEEGCTSLVVPTSRDGPLLINTLDLVAKQRNEPRWHVLQVSHPTQGRASIHLGHAGAVWAWRGINDAGLATGASSGGPRRNRACYDGLFTFLTTRYALQFAGRTDELVDMLRTRPTVFKATNVSMVDAEGRAAIVEHSSSTVAVRRSPDGRPIFAANCFLSDMHAPLPEKVARKPYMRNAQARLSRLHGWTTSEPIEDIDGARTMVRDTNGGRAGQICQDNEVMYTICASIWLSGRRAVVFYPDHPTRCQPWRLSLEPRS
jgi:predicted choloylglycine hydrolase